MTIAQLYHDLKKYVLKTFPNFKGIVLQSQKELDTFLKSPRSILSISGGLSVIRPRDTVPVLTDPPTQKKTYITKNYSWAILI